MLAAGQELIVFGRAKEYRNRIFLDHPEFEIIEEEGEENIHMNRITPIYPLARTVANINIDGVNVHGRTRDLTLIGYGASDLDSYARDATGEQGRIIRPDPEPEKGFYYRSDCFIFARAGGRLRTPDPSTWASGA